MAPTGTRLLSFPRNLSQNGGGTPFGYRCDMVTLRQRDRRQALSDIITTLTRGLDRQSDISLTRGAFEQTLRRLLAARSVQLREAASRLGRTESVPALELISVDVPGTAPVNKYVIEAAFDPGFRLGEWDFQILGLAAHLAALLLEIERGRLQLARAGLAETVRSRRDRPTVLVGSTAPMQALRGTIERVAATDFTVLLEGGSCAELASQLRFGLAPAIGRWQVAGAGESTKSVIKAHGRR